MSKQEQECGVVVHETQEVLVPTRCWGVGKRGFLPRYIWHELAMRHRSADTCCQIQSLLNCAAGAGVQVRPPAHAGARAGGPGGGRP